jgi:glycosyltransferase involved in cell wall biosynthesis
VRVLAGAGERCRADVDVHRDLPRFPVRPVPTGRLAAAAAELRSAAVLERHLAAFAPDAVCWWRLGELSQSLVARVAARGLAAVGVVCDTWMEDGPARDPWCRINGRRPTFEGVAWLCCSGWLRRRLGLGAAGVVHPGIDPTAFHERTSVPPWRGRLLYAGRLSALKGVGDAVAALDHVPGGTLSIVGDGARPRPHPRVTIEPAMHRTALGMRMRAADALLFPVRWDEPWGLVPLEAMACGVPVVATGTGGSAEYLRHETNALLVPPGDSDAIARAVRRLAGDGALRERLVAGGRRTAAAASLRTANEAVEAALAEAVVRRSAAA